MTGIAVIGTGYWGKNHARVCRDLCNEGIVDKVKLCDLNRDRVDELGRSLGLECFSDYRQLLRDNEIQAVVIATDSGTHYQIAKEALEAGKAVLVEKPMTMNVMESEDLVSIAKDRGRILMAGHIFRYHPAICELKRRIDNGDTGEIQSIYSNRETFSMPRRDMGVIYALGTHELDMFCYLMGVDFPQRLIAVTGNPFSKSVEETAVLVLDFGDVKAYAFESWMAPGENKRRDIMVVGSRMSAQIDYLRPHELNLYTIDVQKKDGFIEAASVSQKITVEIPRAEPLKEELKEFMSSIKTGKAPLTDGSVGLRAVIMAEAALKSAKSGRFVDCPPMS